MSIRTPNTRDIGEESSGSSLEIIFRRRRGQERERSRRDYISPLAPYMSHAELPHRIKACLKQEKWVVRFIEYICGQAFPPGVASLLENHLKLCEKWRTFVASLVFSNQISPTIFFSRAIPPPRKSMKGGFGRGKTILVESVQIKKTPSAPEREEFLDKSLPSSAKVHSDAVSDFPKLITHANFRRGSPTIEKRRGELKLFSLYAIHRTCRGVLVELLPPLCQQRAGGHVGHASGGAKKEKGPPHSDEGTDFFASINPYTPSTPALIHGLLRRKKREKLVRRQIRFQRLLALQGISPRRSLSGVSGDLVRSNIQSAPARLLRRHSDRSTTTTTTTTTWRSLPSSNAD